MFVAGNLDKDLEMIESMVAVMEAARVGACSSRARGDPPIRLGPIELHGPALPTPSDGPGEL